MLSLFGQVRNLVFDIRILRVALVHYGAPRYVALGGFVCGGLAATRGIIAGCNLATTWVKVCTIQECDMVVARFPASVFMSTIGRLQRQDRRIMWLGRSPKSLGSLRAKLNGAWAALWLSIRLQ